MAASGVGGAFPGGASGTGGIGAALSTPRDILPGGVVPRAVPRVTVNDFTADDAAMVACSLRLLELERLEEALGHGRRSGSEYDFGESDSD